MDLTSLAYTCSLLATNIYTTYCDHNAFCHYSTWLSHLIHGASWGNHLHDVSSASVCPNRQPTANDLSKGGEVRCDAPVLLCTPFGYPEACHDFIKAQQCTILFSYLLQALHSSTKLVGCCSFICLLQVKGDVPNLLCARCAVLSPNRSQQEIVLKHSAALLPLNVLVVPFQSFDSVAPFAVVRCYQGSMVCLQLDPMSTVTP